MRAHSTPLRKRPLLPDSANTCRVHKATPVRSAFGGGVTQILTLSGPAMQRREISKQFRLEGFISFCLFGSFLSIVAIFQFWAVHSPLEHLPSAPHFGYFVLYPAFECAIIQLCPEGRILAAREAGKRSELGAFPCSVSSVYSTRIAAVGQDMAAGDPSSSRDIALLVQDSSSKLLVRSLPLVRLRTPKNTSARPIFDRPAAQHSS